MMSRQVRVDPGLADLRVVHPNAGDGPAVGVVEDRAWRPGPRMVSDEQGRVVGRVEILHHREGPRRPAQQHGGFVQLLRKEVVEVPMRRSEEHTSELQSLTNLVCRLLLEKKKKEKKVKSDK